MRGLIMPPKKPRFCANCHEKDELFFDDVNEQWICKECEIYLEEGEDVSEE